MGLKVECSKKEIKERLEKQMFEEYKSKLVKLWGDEDFLAGEEFRSSDHKNGVFRAKGEKLKPVIKPKYAGMDYKSPNGIIAVQEKSLGPWGFIDSKGKSIGKPQLNEKGKNDFINILNGTYKGDNAFVFWNINQIFECLLAQLKYDFYKLDNKTSSNMILAQHKKEVVDSYKARFKEICALFITEAEKLHQDMNKIKDKVKEMFEVIKGFGNDNTLEL